MNIEDDFMWVAGNAFSEMRLMVEGAITLFEDDAGVLCRLAREAQKNEAQLALNDIGTALYSFCAFLSATCVYFPRSCSSTMYARMCFSRISSTRVTAVVSANQTPNSFRVCSYDSIVLGRNCLEWQWCMYASMLLPKSM